MSDLHDMSMKEIVRLTRDEARREALEEAAREVGKWKMSSAARYGLRHAILALIDKETRHD